MDSRRKSRIKRHRHLIQYIEENPFVTDEELARVLGVSVPTIRLDRQILGILEVRERVKHVARDALHKPTALGPHEVVGELIDLELNQSGISSHVTLVCKKQAGLSGNTLVAAAGMASFFSDTQDSQDLFFEDTMKSGKFINDPELVRILVHQSEPVLTDLDRLGVNFIRINNQLLRKLNPGHSIPRTVYCTSGPKEHLIRGISILRPLMEHVKKLGVRIIENTPIVRLATEANTVVGAWGLDMKKNEPVWLPAKSVILAAGGGARLFAHNNNTSEMTGDAYSLALMAGATLKDMEFVQFYPTMLQHPVKTTLSTSLFGDGAMLRNNDGKCFMADYAPEERDMATRDKMTQAIFSEIRAGRGRANQVFVDCAQIPKEKLETRHRSLYEFLSQRNIDMTKEWLPVRPATHFFMGGVKINKYCQTTLKGLFAAGECVGGVHGANRLATNALTEAAVFGKIAGISAAQFSLDCDQVQEKAPAFPFPVFGGSNSLLLEEVRTVLRNSMWENASIIRSHGSLSRAIEDLEQCRSGLGSVKIKNFRDLARFLELEGMCLTAEAIIKSALLRQESRGSHFREDVPQEDPAWLGSTEIEMGAGGLEVSFVKKD